MRKQAHCQDGSRAARKFPRERCAVSTGQVARSCHQLPYQFPILVHTRSFVGPVQRAKPGHVARAPQKPHHALLAFPFTMRWRSHSLWKGYSTGKSSSKGNGRVSALPRAPKRRCAMPAWALLGPIGEFAKEAVVRCMMMKFEAFTKLYKQISAHHRKMSWPC